MTPHDELVRVIAARALVGATITALSECGGGAYPIADWTLRLQVLASEMHEAEHEVTQ